MSRTLGWAQNQYVRFGLVAIAIFCGILILIAPATGQKTSGSTYNRAPEGYLGWYRYMQDQGVTIQRWRRPIADLLATVSDPPGTLLQVYPGIVNPHVADRQDWVQDWLAAGNNLVILGLEAPVTAVDFQSQQGSDFGSVIIKTRRRQTHSTDDRMVLGDGYGAVVWRSLPQAEASTDAVGGVVFGAVTPHLAANAYRDAPGNYPLLADLVTQLPGPIWVDEYLHGYREAEAIAEAIVNSWEAYLARTPVKIVVVQLGIILLILLVAHSRRPGNLTMLKEAAVDNSRAYIEALAAVLHKAESTSFLVDMITKAERSALQRSLGLSDSQVEDAVLQKAWTDQTNQSQQAIAPLLQPPRRLAKGQDAALQQWLLRLLRMRQTPRR